VALTSTTNPGTTRERMAPILEESGLVAGRDFFLAYSPERVDPGRTDYTLRNAPKVLAGLTEACGDRAEALYREVCDEIVRVSSPEAAELTKLLQNIFRSVNIAMVNEIAMLTDRMGIDIWEVVEAAATKPYGFMRFDPRPGMGGHCLPVDPFYLSWRARVRRDDRVHRARGQGQPADALPLRLQGRARAQPHAGKAVKGSRVSLFGDSYKPGVGDMRQSPALKIAALLGALGADPAYYDHFVPALPDDDIPGLGFDEALDRCDMAVIVTAHPGVDHDAIAERAPLVVDLRGVTRGARKTVLL
jgi:UDP-N-acetyl-D-glucosamine dehydrogenase